MTKRKNTKRAFLCSVLSVIICISMLVGTTFAWFTDKVESGKNKIVAGNLDIEVEYSKDMTDGSWTSVQNTEDLFKDVTLWEPGATSVVYLKVTNAGTLALKYALSINVDSETEGTNVDGEAFKLSDYIQFAQIKDVTAAYATRDAARAAATSSAKIGDGYSLEGSMQPEAEMKIALVVFMPETVGNKANYKTGTTVPEIDMSLVVNATQLVSESDSFDNTYDAGAPWLGGYEAVPAEAEGVITIVTPEQLAGFAKSVNEGTSYADKTIKLANNLDLNNIEWPGINTSNSGAFTFDGNGKTIKNLKISTTGSAGLFTTAPSCTIKNLTVDGASVAGVNYAAAIVGHGLCTKVENCTVKNAAIVTTPVANAEGKYDEGAKAGAIVGYLSGEPVAYVKNCEVSDTTIAAFRDLGAFTGIANGTSEVSGNKVGENVKLSYIFVAPYIGNTSKQNENMTKYAGRISQGATVENNEGVPEMGEANLIATVADLKMLATAVNGGFDFAGQTVKLGNDIDCEGANMLPIGTEDSDAKFNGTFDGNGKTVKNANIKANSGAGFIGYIGSGTLKNVTLENVNVTGVEHVGVLVGYTATGAGTVTGCTVKNCSATGIMRDENDDSANGIGGIIGHVAQGGGTIYLTNNTFDGLTLNGYRRIGTFAGGTQVGAGMSGVDISGNTAKNVTINQNIGMNGNPKKLAEGATIGEYLGDLYTNEYLAAVQAANTIEGTVTINTECTLNTVDDLVGFAKQVNKTTGYNTFNNQTVKLGADIDLAGVEWTPIGNVSAYPSQSFYGVFDGQGHTISNLTCTNTLSNYATAGLFGSLMGTVKNVNLKNVNITSSHYAGGIVGYSSSSGSKVENCTVDGGTITSAPELLGSEYDNGDKVGGIFGYNGEGGPITGCTVKNVTIKAYRDLGGIVGASSGTVSGNRVENVTIIQDNTNGYKTSIDTYHEIFGRDLGVSDQSGNSHENVILKKQ